MKKIFASCYLFFSIALRAQVFAQEEVNILEAAQIPLNRTVETIAENIKFSLQQMYPEIKTFETKYNDKLKTYRAVFEIEQNKFQVSFNEEGNWKETYVEIHEDFIPNKIKEGLSKSRFKAWEYSQPTLYQRPNAILYTLIVNQGARTYLLEMSKEGEILQEVMQE
ncbi:MAG: PepSY-like domain-containing protein [Microscillaceae bacterium]|nr:PepSY-like domain-containing protein [Microscillaceae bacterium]